MLQALFISYIEKFMKINLKKHIKIVISYFYKFSQTMSQNLC
jgi:hypothetical protein